MACQQQIEYQIDALINIGNLLIFKCQITLWNGVNSVSFERKKSRHLY